MEIHLCGVRGSTPAVGEDFVGVGGHTSCVALAHDGANHPTLVLDAGTGLRRLSKSFGADPFNGTLLIGHLHWDHMMGIPFFPAGDRPGASVHLMIPEQGVEPSHLIERMMSPPFFPIGTAQLRGDWTFGTYGEETFEAEGFTITAREIPHKGGRTMGLRVSDGRTTVAYLSDHAPTDLGPGDDGLGALHPAAIALAQDADVLVHDAQYTSTELPGRITWGHAAADYAVTLGQTCNVGTVLLFHHDPNRTDDQVADLRRNLAVPAGVNVQVAVEGAVIRL